MMAESVNDVASVQQNIVRSLEGANKDITNQARLTRDLQQDLMRVRMVPVDSVADRLYRVVRQAAKETGKRVNLNIVGGHVELDRGVLERMAGPFEHLLRNAVVHGIESRDTRDYAGKAEVGQIAIGVRQEGNEVVMEFADDGAGLDLERIRAKAVERGMLPSPDAVGDAEAAELIFAPGFTTASEVTELAGRGVGMDVVRTEAASLGGRVEIQTVAGQGSRFSIRLPLTLAVTQVVLVRAGERVFAMPSVLIEQVQQLRPNVIAGAYNDGNVLVLGERIEFAYLPALLGDHTTVPTAQRYSPVVAVRAGGRRLALHVDEVIGNQEVVVKNIGPQLSRMIGIAGATVLGSGEIVLILNPVQLVGRVDTRHAPRPQLMHATQVGAVGNIVEGAQPPRTETNAMTTAPVVMVVDDSVTVRRVTQRLLLREGYQVVLAKDGVDALEQLQDFAPDIMLVDIEMPRMDGFDLTRNVRSDNRFREIPIVMITSRTADKHRNMAFSLGVNVYLGKPYQEHELLDTIKGFVGQREVAPQ
jgi:chemosensory pili system protein ChpA (sensor histidine kinase/response regulator)